MSSLKNLLFLVVITAFLPNCYAVQVSKNHVGPISIGDSKADLLEKWGDSIKEDSIILEGELIPVFRVMFENSHSVIIEFDENNKVSGFRISDAFFETEKKIKVGSSFKEVIEAYPKYDLYYGREEGGYLSIGVEEIGILFSFDPSILNNNGAPIENYEKLYDFKVQNIFVH